MSGSGISQLAWRRECWESREKEIAKMNDAIRQNKERAMWDKQAPGYDRRNLRVYKNAYDLSIQKARAVLWICDSVFSTVFSNSVTPL